MYSCLGFQVFEVMLIRCGLYVLQVQQAPLLDLAANTGYKYIGYVCERRRAGGCVDGGGGDGGATATRWGLAANDRLSPPLTPCLLAVPPWRSLCINMLAGMVLGRWVYRVAMLWTGSMTSYFMVRRAERATARRCPLSCRLPAGPPAGAAPAGSCLHLPLPLLPCS